MPGNKHRRCLSRYSCLCCVATSGVSSVSSVPSGSSGSPEEYGVLSGHRSIMSVIADLQKQGRKAGVTHHRACVLLMTSSVPARHQHISDASHLHLTTAWGKPVYISLASCLCWHTNCKSYIGCLWLSSKVNTKGSSCELIMPLSAAKPCYALAAEG